LSFKKESGREKKVAGAAQRLARKDERTGLAKKWEVSIAKNGVTVVLREKSRKKQVQGGYRQQIWAGT